MISLREEKKYNFLCSLPSCHISFVQRCHKLFHVRKQIYTEASVLSVLCPIHTYVIHAFGYSMTPRWREVHYFCGDWRINYVGLFWWRTAYVGKILVGKRGRKGAWLMDWLTPFVSSFGKRTERYKQKKLHPWHKIMRLCTLAVTVILRRCILPSRATAPPSKHYSILS